MEIGRGCTRGCRFCQAGYIYRPVRERSPEEILANIEATLTATGYDEVSLLSLATGDYGCLTPLLQELMRRYAESRVAVSFPSLRVGTLSPELVEEVKKVRKTGLTLAPEAGSERLRQVINKGISEESLLADARAAYGAGWRLIKLYFMIGLPTETMADVEGIVELARQVKREGKLSGNGGEVNVSVSSFVPKAHTPFQWEPQISYEEILTRQEYLRSELKRKKLNFKWHDAPLSVIEGVFARGDRRLGLVLLEAVRLGCRFDSWGDHFSFSKWQKAFSAVGIDPRFYLRRRELDEVLPWDHIDSGIGREFLLQERERAVAGQPTVDCRSGSCSACGVCDFKEVRMRLAQKAAALPPAPPAGRSEAPEMERIRVRYAKTGAMIYLSHLELITLFTRAVKRAAIPVRFSLGFHPHPKFSFATALSVGVESSAEYLDVEIDAGFGADRLKESLNSVLPEGVAVLAAGSIPVKSPSLSTIMAGVRYRVTLSEAVAELPQKAAAFMATPSHPFSRLKKHGLQEYDLRHELYGLSAAENSLTMEIGRGKPLEFVAAITGLDAASLKACRIEKLAVIFKDSSCLI
jgi:radical SAM-linked protein